MSKPAQKKRAIELRRRGQSIKDIAAVLGVSKSSVSAWCQGISLTDKQKEKLQQKQIDAGNVGRQIGANKNREKRLAAIRDYQEKGVVEIGKLSERDLRLLGIGLYWGEGVKSRSGMAALVNSDPQLIKLGKLWFERCLHVSEEQFTPYVYVSETHAKRERDIILFWSKELNIPSGRFKFIMLKGRPKKRYENHDSYYGVLSLRVCKSTDLKYKIQGLIEACKLGGN
ncbi:helix-turn-helix domain-containing protein [Candidatus Nomurabacteria bacterium]|nr:helix-turn-helix domain-containing protein [Candidatus Nomurabacteria bacterium]